MDLIKEWDKEFIADTYARFPIHIKRGKGAVLEDENGKKYIDLGSGIAVNSFGACDEEFISAVTNQLNRLIHTSNLYYTEPCVKLAKMLCEKTGFKKVFFSNSGAEANECAIKATRKYASINKGKEYYNIITLKDSFHGRTITTLSATGQDTYHTQFNPLTPGFLYATANDICSMEKLLKENKCAGIMLEIVQGEGGVNTLCVDYLQQVQELAKKYDVILTIDEVQTGNGRTGKLYGYMHSGITPDIVTTAKGLGGGLPIGATLLGEKVKNVYTKGDHGSTFGGNPVCCAGAISILQRIDDNLLNSVMKKSQIIIDTLNNTKGVISITGLGLMLGIETKRDANEIVNECLENGVLVLNAKNKIRLLPPLNISIEDLQKALDVFKIACEKE